MYSKPMENVTVDDSVCCLLVVSLLHSTGACILPLLQQQGYCLKPLMFSIFFSYLEGKLSHCFGGIFQ